MIGPGRAGSVEFADQRGDQTVILHHRLALTPGRHLRSGFDLAAVIAIAHNDKDWF